MHFKSSFYFSNIYSRELILNGVKRGWNQFLNGKKLISQEYHETWTENWMKLLDKYWISVAIQFVYWKYLVSIWFYVDIFRFVHFSHE